jgi:hypothetical protein
MRLETPLIAIIIACLFFVGLYTAFDDIAAEYSDYPTFNYISNISGGNGSIEVLMDTLTNSTNDVNKIYGNYKNTTLSDTGSLFAFYSLAKNIGDLALNQLNIIKAIGVGIVEVLGIPQEILFAAFSILLITFVVSLIYILLGRSD